MSRAEVESRQTRQRFSNPDLWRWWLLFFNNVVIWVTVLLILLRPHLPTSTVNQWFHALEETLVLPFKICKVVFANVSLSPPYCSLDANENICGVLSTFLTIMVFWLVRTQLRLNGIGMTRAFTLLITCFMNNACIPSSLICGCRLRWRPIASNGRLHLENTHYSRFCVYWHRFQIILLYFDRQPVDSPWHQYFGPQPSFWLGCCSWENYPQIHFDSTEILVYESWAPNHTFWPFSTTGTVVWECPGVSAFWKLFPSALILNNLF